MQSTPSHFQYGGMLTTREHVKTDLPFMNITQHHLTVFPHDDSVLVSSNTG